MYTKVENKVLHTYILKEKDLNTLQDLVLLASRFYKVRIHTRHLITINIKYIHSKDKYKVTLVDRPYNFGLSTYVNNVSDIRNIVLRILRIET